METIIVHSPSMAVAVMRDGQTTVKGSALIPDDLVVGANGAGDAFAAGALYAIHEGWRMDEVLALGHSVAAVSLRSLTCTGAIESWQRCIELANGWGWRAA